MGYQSKTYSLSDEVVAAIEAARAAGETPNQLLTRVLVKPADKVVFQLNPTDVRITDEQSSLDVVGPELSDGRGKVTTETKQVKGGK